MMPNYYLSYFYTTDRKLAEQDAVAPIPWRAGDGHRGGSAQGIRRPGPVGAAGGPDEARRRVPTPRWRHNCSNAHYNDLNETHVVDTAAPRCAVAGWPADWVLEMPVRVSGAGFGPLPAAALPAACFGLVAAVKSYQLLTVEAARPR